VPCCLSQKWETFRTACIMPRFRKSSTGSAKPAKPEPNDVDLFLLMDDTFDLSQVTGEARLVFDHPAVQAHFGASIFWLRRLAALPNEEEAILGWQLKRDGTRRGIVEIKEALP
jgi:hypothetical protein